MQLLEVDSVRNRLHITLSETFDETEAEQLLAEVASRMAELSRGFVMLCDLTSLDEFAHDARKHFRSIMDLCNAHGVGRVIRIVPDPLNDFGLTVLSHFHYDHAIPIITCRCLGEALKHLRVA